MYLRQPITSKESGQVLYSDRQQDEWVKALADYVYLGRHRAVLRRFRALSYGGLFAFGITLMFLVHAAPHRLEIVSFITISGLLVAALAAPVANHWYKRVDKARSALARRFFEAGLRPQGRDRLVTNVAHPQVIVDLRTRD